MQELTTSEAFDDLVARSHEQPFIVFKHSNRCPISADAKERVEDAVSEGVIDLPVFCVVVHDVRELSDHIASSLNVPHQSPQVIVVTDGNAVYDADHGDITGAGIQEALS